MDPELQDIVDDLTVQKAALDQVQCDINNGRILFEGNDYAMKQLNIRQAHLDRIRANIRFAEARIDALNS